MNDEKVNNKRKNKFLKIGRNKGFITNLEGLSSLKPIERGFSQILKSKRIVTAASILGLIVLVSMIFLL